MFQQPISTYQGWGMDPAYMTPSYMANFRPSYGGDDPSRNPYASNNSLGYNINMAMGPRNTPWGADPFQHIGAAKAEVVSAPMDAAMAGLQSVAIPLAAWYVANKALGSTGIASGIGRFAGRGAAGLGASALGGAMGMAGRIPYLGTLARGASSLAGSAGLGGLATAGLGSMGAFAGGVMLPLLAGQALASGIDSAIIDPYVSTRRGMDSMRSNLANQFVTGPGGATTGGMGMSATRAYEISSELTKAGASSFAFNTQDFNKFADMGMSAGLFQEIGDMDPKKIVESTKSMMKTIQTLSAIAGGMSDPDMIQVLSRLKSGGLDDFRRMNSVVKRLGGASALSGSSINEIMDTVGNQGMLMAQQQGIQGVTGLLASADAYAGFTNARRAGLISGAQMSALGGVEGMTQNVMSGAMKSLNNPYGMMTMMSGGDFGQSVQGSIMGWGSRMSGNPLATMGDWALNQGVYKDRSLSKEGTSGIVLKTLQSKAKMMGMDSKDPRVLASLASSEGISYEEIRSILQQNQSYRDPGSSLRAFNALDAKNRQEQAARLNQEGLGLAGIPVVGDIQRFFKEVGTSTVAAGANVGNGPASLAAGATDVWDRLTSKTMGIKLPDEMTARVQNTESAVSYSLEGYVTRTKSGYYSPGSTSDNGNTETVKSSRWRKEIGAIMSMANNGSAEQKAMALELLELLKDGKDRTPEGAKRAKELITNMDANGDIFGTGDELTRRQAAEQFAGRAYMGNELKSTAKVQKSDQALLDESLSGLTKSTGLSSKDTSEILSSIHATGGSRERLSKLFKSPGMKDRMGDVAKVLGLSSGASIADMISSAEKITNTDIGDIGSEEDLRKQLLMRTGGDSGLVDSIMKRNDADTLMGNINDTWYKDRNTSTKLNEVIANERATYESENDLRNRQNGSVDIDMQYVKDIGKNIELGFKSVNWDKNMDSNTRALARLTDALVGANQGDTLRSITEKLR